MDTLRTKSGIWYKLHRPTKQEIAWLRDEFKLHELILAELQRPTTRPKVQRFGSHLYLALHFPIFNEKERKTYPREIDFVIGKKEIITVSFEPIPPLDEFFKICAVDKSCQDLYASKTTLHFLYYIIRELYEFSLRQLDHIQAKIGIIEEEIFSGKERNVVAEISIVGRDIIDFRRSLKPQGVTIDSLAAEGEALFGKNIIPFLEGLQNEYQKLWGLLETQKETLDALYETNTTLLNIKQNDTMRILTIIATTTFPLSLLAALLATDAVSNPILGNAYDFWIVAGLLVLGATVILGVFKKNKWF